MDLSFIKKVGVKAIVKANESKKTFTGTLQFCEQKKEEASTPDKRKRKLQEISNDIGAKKFRPPCIEDDDVVDVPHVSNNTINFGELTERNLRLRDDIDSRGNRRSLRAIWARESLYRLRKNGYVRRKNRRN